MEIKNLFDPVVKEEIIGRINKLSPATQHKWGSMDVAQMLAHCQKPLGVAVGHHKLKGNFFYTTPWPFHEKNDVQRKAV